MRSTKIHKIEVPIYNQVVNVLITNNIKNAALYFEANYPGIDMDNVEYVDAFMQRVNNKEKGVSKLYIAILEDCTPGTLVHECVHAAWDILDYIGVGVTADNDEALAYLTQFLFDKTSVIKEKQLKIKTSTTIKA